MTKISDKSEVVKAKSSTTFFFAKAYVAAGADIGELFEVVVPDPDQILPIYKVTLKYYN
jgi:hypothetical protein